MALSKAERYCVLIEPLEAESTCRDILAIGPDNQEELTRLLLALTDMFLGQENKVEEARSIASRLASPVQRAYYTGVVEERLAKDFLLAGHDPAAVLR